MSLRAFWVWGFGLCWACAVVAEPALPLPVDGEAGQVQVTGPEDQTAGTPWQQGLATWYGGRRWHGRRTASGERFDRQALTAAHPSLPLGAWIKVVNLTNGQQVHVRINDRGPRGKRYIIDLSEAAAERLGFRRDGWTRVALHRSAPPHTPD